MAFNRYLFDQDAIAEAAEVSAANLKANRGLSDLEGFAIGVIVRRLAKDPMRYRDYGMYWAELKEVLRKHGYDYGEPVFPLVRESYRGKTDLYTIVMADEFRKYYLATWAVGTIQFVLDDDNPEYVDLIDESMERLSA